jgi:hypothetical protein
MERTNRPTFVILGLLNNVVMNLNHLVQKLLKDGANKRIDRMLYSSLRYDIAHNFSRSCLAFVWTKAKSFAPPSYLKTLSNKTMIQIKCLGRPITLIFKYKRFRLFKCHSSRVEWLQALTAASMKIRAFWDVVPCSLGVDRRFRGAYCLHHQGDEVNQHWKKKHEF